MTKMISTPPQKIAHLPFYSLACSLQKDIACSRCAVQTRNMHLNKLATAFLLYLKLHRNKHIWQFKAGVANWGR